MPAAAISAPHPTRDATSCSGNAIWLKTIAGSGTINGSSASGNASCADVAGPQTNSTAPASDADERDPGQEQLGREPPAAEDQSD